MRQRKLGSHTPPCHRRMVMTTLFSVLLAALQRRPVLYHTRERGGKGGSGGQKKGGSGKAQKDFHIPYVPHVRHLC